MEFIISQSLKKNLSKTMTNNRNVYVLFSETGFFSASLPGREWKLFHRSIVIHIYLLLNALLLFLIVHLRIHFSYSKNFSIHLWCCLLRQKDMFFLSWLEASSANQSELYSDWKEIGSFSVYVQLCIISIAQFLNLIFHSLQK